MFYCSIFFAAKWVLTLFDLLLAKVILLMAD